VGVAEVAQRSGRGTSGEPPPGIESASAEDLTREIDELETLPRFDRDGAGERAGRAVAAARRLGRTELELRAQLVQAEVLQRRGELADGGRIAQDVLTWATDHNSGYLLARSHYVLQGVFMDLGDLSLALEHSVRAVDLLDDSAAAPLRFDHLIRLADCLGLNGDEAAARERYPQVLRLAEDLGDIDRQLVALNNRAYFESLTGDFEAALEFSTRLQDLASTHGMTLHVGRLDTIARALMGLGPADAVGALELLRRSVRSHPWTGLSDPVTISVGATSTDDVPAAEPAPLLSRADAQLYRAKSGGRDRVVSDQG
jgi:tetratricopeptide (TPR) repeat protein